MTPETRARIDVLQRRAIDKTITEEEMIEAVKLLREGRVSAAFASEGAKVRRAKAAGPAINGDDLLKEMLG